MDTGNIGFIAQWGLAPDKTGEFRLFKGGQDGGKPRRRLGVAIARIVTDAVGMRYKQCRHSVNLYCA
jgi:hypothetical protein